MEPNMTVREPRLTPVAITDLRPTQITVGMREVKAKRKHWRELAEKKKDKDADFLGKHMIPVILGPKQRPYVIDHHHLALALHGEGVKEVAVTVIANLSMLDPDSFWFVIDRPHFRNSLIGAPMLKQVGAGEHYIVCVQLNGHNQHKEKVVIYLGTTINQFVDAT